MHSQRLVFCTCPDRETGLTIASALVEKRLAACANLVPGLTSVYHWQGEIQQDEEVLLLIKTPAGRFEALREAVLELHPYELPEIIAVPISEGLPAYLNWIDQSCVPNP